MIRHFVSTEFVKFLAAGGIAAVVNMASRWALDFRMGYSAAIVLAYLIGMVTAYGLNRRLVFERSGRSVRSELLRFTGVNLLGIAQVWLISVGLGDHGLPAMGIHAHAHDIAHIIAVGFPVFTSFLGHKFWSFSKRRLDQD